MRELRRATEEDFLDLAEIFWRGVHEGAAPRYDLRQRQAWLPERPCPTAFAERLRGDMVFVAREEGATAGFMTLRADGYMGFAYVRPEARGQGTASALLGMVETKAGLAGLLMLTTRASDMARPFLTRHGWHVLRAAPQIRRGVFIPATDMGRHLTPGLAPPGGCKSPEGTPLSACRDWTGPGSIVT